jgi:hypothetical protein
MQNNYVLVFALCCGQDWNLRERNGILEKLINHKIDLLSDKFYDLIDTLDETTIKKFKRFLDQQDEDNIIIEIKKDLKMLLYNNRNISEKTRRIFEQSNNNLIE